MTPKTKTYNSLSKKFKALAHPARLKLLERLIREDCCVSEIEDCLSISQPRVSQHLKVLKRAGIIQGKRDKRRICYRISDEWVRDLINTISSRSVQR
jgi:DNA-binding transcriptional ArsR family regulator